MRQSKKPSCFLAWSIPVLLGVTLACGSSSSGSGRINPTFVEVSPEEFLSDVTCTTAKGGMRYYVATLIDVTPDEDGNRREFRLPSSPPTPCRQSVFFSGVAPSRTIQGVFHPAHEYVAEIEGYDQESLRPKHEGSAIMLSGGNTVAPRFIGSCGKPTSELLPLTIPDAGAPEDAADAGFATHFDGPVKPLLRRTVTLRGCNMIDLSSSQQGTAVVVSLNDALGALRCGDEPGTIDHFEVESSGVTVSAPCDGEAVFDDVETGSLLRFSVTAYEAAPGGTAWTTTCYQEAAPGLELAARCDPLVVSN